jgi:hypothetical protein
MRMLSVMTFLAHVAKNISINGGGYLSQEKNP